MKLKFTCFLPNFRDWKKAVLGVFQEFAWRPFLKSFMGFLERCLRFTYLMNLADQEVFQRIQEELCSYRALFISFVFDAN